MKKKILIHVLDILKNLLKIITKKSQMKENYQIYLTYQFRLRVHSLNQEPQLPHKEMSKWRGVTLSLWTGGEGHPTPFNTPTHPQHSNIQKDCWKRSFSHFSTRSPWQMDQQMDQQTDKASYRVACPQVKTCFSGICQKVEDWLRLFSRWKKKYKDATNAELSMNAIKTHFSAQL